MKKYNINSEGIADHKNVQYYLASDVDVRHEETPLTTETDTGAEVTLDCGVKCPLCDHEWSRHDPEDGKCDAGPPCKCGRDLRWMQEQIAKKSLEALRKR